MPLTNLDEKQGCRIALWVVGCGVGLLLLVLSILGPRRLGPHGPDIRVRSQMKSLEMAIKGFQTEYNRLPSSQSPPPITDNSSGYDTTSVEGKRIIEILTGTHPEQNPRGISFYEPPTARRSGSGYTKEGGLVDLWGTKGYIIILDYDGDKEISDPEHPGAKIAAWGLIYSAGPDSNFSTWKDNVKSWDNR